MGNSVIYQIYQIDEEDQQDPEKDANIQDYIDMKKYQKGYPSVINAYYKTNLLAVVDQLPDQPFNSGQPSIMDLPPPVQHNQPGGFLEGLENATIAKKHQFDKHNDLAINQYTITKNVLGRGSHCFVKLAKKDNQDYAMKIFSMTRLRKKILGKDEQLLKMINSEIGFLKKLVHPNIIKFYEAIYSVETEKIFLVMENCSKGSLLKVILSSVTLSDEVWIKTVKKYFVQISKGIQFMHRKNIIHRDIKTENILVDDSNHIKIIDFNVSAQSTGKIKFTGRFVGTKTYAPPQLVLPLKDGEERLLDGRSVDVWALGVTLYEMIERKHPFRCNNIQQLINILQKPISIPYTYQPQMKDLLSKMLTFENSKRIGMDDILKHPWLREQLF